MFAGGLWTFPNFLQTTQAITADKDERMSGEKIATSKIVKAAAAASSTASHSND